MKPPYYNLSVDVIQLYITKQVDLHPHLYEAFLEKIMELQHKDVVSAVPLTLFESFYFRIQRKMKKVA